MQIKLFTAQKFIEFALKYSKMTKSKKTSKIWLPNETKHINTCSKMLLDNCYAFGLLL